jgi:putative tricarboxylic transport membrane protein
MTLSTSETEGRVATDAARPRAPLGPRLLGAVVLAVGLFLLWQAYDQAGGDYSPGGPWLAPLVVTAGWVLAAGWYLVRQLVAPELAADPEPATSAVAEPAGTATAEPTAAAVAEPAEEPATTGEEVDGGVQWLTPALLGAALCGYVFALEPAGFVLASAVFFVVAARILGSRRPLRDVLVGVLLALAVYLGFTYLLTISLPSGVLPI